jgi:hypothetical protein
MLKVTARGARLLLAFGVAGTAFGIATVVQAAIPDSHGTIKAAISLRRA